MFQLPELECYEAMLTRLLKEECEEIVMGYEGYRMALLQEFDRRTRQMALNAAAGSVAGTGT